MKSCEVTLFEAFGCSRTGNVILFNYQYHLYINIRFRKLSKLVVKTSKSKQPVQVEITAIQQVVKHFKNICNK